MSTTAPDPASLSLLSGAPGNGTAPGASSLEAANYAYAVTLKSSGEIVRADDHSEDVETVLGRKEVFLLGARFVKFTDGTLVRADELAALKPLEPEEAEAIDGLPPAPSGPPTPSDVKSAADDIMATLEAHRAAKNESNGNGGAPHVGA